MVDKWVEGGERQEKESIENHEVVTMVSTEANFLLHGQPGASPTSGMLSWLYNEKGM